MYLFIRLLFLTTVLLSQKVFAVAFDSCPSKAYLFQGKPVSVYGINLVTGTNSLLQNDTGLPSNINGVGFNETDRYIYGYDTTNYTIVRLGQNFQATTLNVSGLPSDKTFYVGDVYQHHYYVYRSGTGFYKIDLSPLDSNVNATLTLIYLLKRSLIRVRFLRLNSRMAHSLAKMMEHDVPMHH
jgi:hypothetical protein